MRSSDSFAIQRQPMRKPVATPRAGAHRDGAVAGLLRVSFRFRDSSVVMRFLRLYRPVMLATVVAVASTQPVVAAGNLTLPFADPHPRITSWTDHHYPDRQDDGTMIRFDGATGYAYDGHRGTDFAVPSNSPVLAADEGTVIYSEWSDSGGWGVVIDHAYDRTAYFHNNQLFVYPGQHVSRGQLIALSGSTGNSTGPHLHFEVRDLLTPWHSVDPYGWTGPGKDPWRWDLGYLWTSNPPVPFLLPLAFPGGAHWNYWYGTDGPPPPVTWRLRDGGHGLAGFAARWDTVRFLGDPGASYQLRLTVRDAARNPAPPVVVTASIPARTALPATVADHAVLGALPAQPNGAATTMGVRQEHPSAEGALLLGTDASLHGLGGSGSTPNAAPTSVASAVDVATLPSGPLRLLADGTTWNSAGAAGPRFSGKAPVRLVGASDGGLIAIDAGGAIALAASPLAGAGRAGGSVSLSAGATLVDAALFPGSHAGLALDSAGAVHAFGAADAALSGITSGWTLTAQPVAIALSGTPQAPAGIVTDASGDWQTFGSMLLLPDATFGGPLFDSTTGLPVR